MILLVGLGNPGPKFANNRHNIGFMAADEIVRRHNLSSWRKKFHGEFAEGVVDGHKVMVLKPMTYMNESGRAVAAAARFYGLDADNVVVIYDELDLPAGKMRMKTGGGLAGHNGLKSIKAHLGADFHRLRLGIGHPGHKDKVQGYVLKDFPKVDREWLDPLLDAVSEHAGLLASREFATFQNRVHLRINPSAGAPAETGKPAKAPDKPAAADKPAEPSGPFATLKRLVTGKQGDT